MYRSRRAKGLCGGCGKVPSKKALCKTCREREATYKKARYKRRRESNRCVKCNTEHKEEGRILCATCREKKSTSQKATYKRKRESDRCTRCPNPREGKGLLCKTCREKVTARYHIRRESNRCTDCSTLHEEEGVRCATCAERHREYLENRYKHRRESNLCLYCSNPRQGKVTYCETCLQTRRERDKPCRDIWMAWKHKVCACGCSDWRVIGAINPKGHMFSDYSWWKSHGGPEALETALVGATPTCRNCHRKTKKRSKRRWVREEKERRKACAFCGLMDDPRVYEFDHIDPSTKNFDVGKAKTKKAFLKEVEKCQMLCANCHHVKTHYIADVK